MRAADLDLNRHAIILFDGFCNLCNGAVNFLIDRDPEGYFKFAALQSDVATSLLSKYDLPAAYLESLVVIEKGRVYARSDAVLRIVRHMPAAWPLASVLRVLPRRLRDALYDWIARNRYRWFGKRPTCRVPTPDLAARFL